METIDLDTVLLFSTFFGIIFGILLTIAIISNAIVTSNDIGRDIGDFRDFGPVFGAQYNGKMDEAGYLNLDFDTYCPYCGYQMEENTKICSRCGKSIS